MLVWGGVLVVYPLLTYYRSLWKLTCAFLFSVLGQIPAELDPETPSKGSGLKNDAERDENPNYDGLSLHLHVKRVTERN